MVQMHLSKNNHCNTTNVAGDVSVRLDGNIIIDFAVHMKACLKPVIHNQ